MPNPLTPRQLASHAMRATRKVRDFIKLLQLYPFGLRAHATCSIAWSASVDGGGAGGQVILGRNTMLDIGTVLRADGGLIQIGEDCTVNPYSVLIGSKPGLVIGNGVRIAAHTVIVATNHNFSDVSRYIHLQGNTAKGILIEDDVWVGAGAKILDGVTVRRGTVVAAGAVVTKSTESYSVVAGTPARKIGARGSLAPAPLSPVPPTATRKAAQDCSTH